MPFGQRSQQAVQASSVKHVLWAKLSEQLDIVAHIAVTVCLAAGRCHRCNATGMLYSVTNHTPVIPTHTRARINSLCSTLSVSSTWIINALMLLWHLGNIRGVTGRKYLEGRLYFPARVPCSRDRCAVCIYLNPDHSHSPETKSPPNSINWFNLRKKSHIFTSSSSPKPSPLLLSSSCPFLCVQVPSWGDGVSCLLMEIDRDSA